MDTNTVLKEFFSTSPLGFAYNAIPKKKDQFASSKDTEQTSTGSAILVIFRSMCMCFAIYLAWRCNGGFWSYVLAFLFSEIYIVVKLIQNGMCGIVTRPAT